MKKILIAAVLVSAVASPAFAATKHHRRVVTPPPVAWDSYAMMPASDVVVQNGQVLGVDPDPFIRASLIRQGDPANLSN